MAGVAGVAGVGAGVNMAGTPRARVVVVLVLSLVLAMVAMAMVAIVVAIVVGRVVARVVVASVVLGAMVLLVLAVTPSCSFSISCNAATANLTEKPKGRPRFSQARSGHQNPTSRSRSANNPTS